MNYFSVKYKIVTVTILLTVSPFVAWAQVGSNVCSSVGYSIETLNGIFTDKDGAISNRDALRYYFEKTYHGEPLTIDFLLNQTHKALDLPDVAIQKTFEGVDMWDPDFIKILTDASEQVKTQKVLVVSHSQGNFYGNNFYKVVTDDGDVSKQSIGVYGVASPASFVAGGGLHLTSSTDKVISFLVENVLPGTIAPTNDTIDYKWSDDPMGHDFAKVYLSYRSQTITDDIKWSLGQLAVDPTRSEDTLCINPPKELSTLVKTIRPVVYATEVVLVSGVATVTIAKNTVVGTAVGTYHIALNTVIWTYNTTEAFAKWGSHMEAVAIVWTYDTTVTVGKFVGNTAVAGVSTVYDAVAGVLTSKPVAGNNNTASVILATQQAQKMISANKQATTVTNVASQPATAQVITSQKPQTVFVFEPKVQAGTNVPKLVFIGSFASGAISQVLGSQSIVAGEEEVVIVEEAIADNAGAGIPAPALSAPQCAQTLATDGCLLATTTVHFEWAPVPGTDHYEIDKNGIHATTTDVSLDVTIKDFSDYTLEVAAVDADGNRNATSTQVSVATIPIAINEIAWMGTVASATDEWFEIKNNTSHTIDLSQWELSAKNNSPRVTLKGTIASHAYIIFERTDDTAVKDVKAHATTTGAFDNIKGDQLSLSRDSVIFDQTPEGEWVAGYNSTSSRKTMERYSSRELGTDPNNWGTNLGDTRTQQERYDCYFRLDKQHKDTRECFTEGFIKNGTDADGNAIGGTPGAQNSVSALINKGKNITKDFTLTADEESYVIPDGGKVYIGASSTLTIEPGVTISFYGGQWDEKHILIEGKLDAQGTAENPIVFNSFFPNKQVGGIQFSTSTATSTLSHVLIENTNGILITNGAKLEIRDSQFINNDFGVDLDGKSTLAIENTRFATTTDGSVRACGGSFVSIASSTIINTIDGAAIDVCDGAFLSVASTTIDGAYDWANAGIEASDSTVLITNSTIRNTSSDGISAYNSNVSIEGSVISDTLESGMDFYNSTSTVKTTVIEDVYGWSGIGAVYGMLSVSSSTIRNVYYDGIGLYSASSTISDTVIENGTGNGIFIEGGTAEITDTTVSGFAGGGISITDPIVPVLITDGEITGNNVFGVVSTPDAVIFTDVSTQVHDNGISAEDNVVVW